MILHDRYLDWRGSPLFLYLSSLALAKELSSVCFQILNGLTTLRLVTICTSYMVNYRRPLWKLIPLVRLLSIVCAVWQSQRFFVLIACQGDVPFLSGPSFLARDLVTFRFCQVLRHFSSLRSFLG